MHYRITYHAHGDEDAELITVSSRKALFALIDYANRWHAAIVLVEQRAGGRGRWTKTDITQND